MRVAAIGTNRALPEPHAAAVTPLRVVHGLAAPGANQPGQHVARFRSTNRLLGENLGVVASNMIHDTQRSSGVVIDQPIPQLLRQSLAIAIHDVARMNHMFGNLQSPAARSLQPAIHALVQPRLMLIHLHAFVVNCERCHARGGDIFNADFCRDRPQTRCYQQRTFDRDKVAVRRKARAARALRLRTISRRLPSQPKQIVDAANENLGPRVDSTQNAARRKKKIVFRDLFDSLGRNHRCRHVCSSFVYPSR